MKHSNTKRALASVLAAAYLLVSCGPTAKRKNGNEEVAPGEKSTLDETAKNPTQMENGQTTAVPSNSNVELFSGLPAANFRQTVNVAVIDSGVDLRHSELGSLGWVNPGEIANNSKDDEGNSYVDDINGWNFTRNNNETVDASKASSYSADVKRYMDIAGRNSIGQATSDEISWAQSKRSDQQFMKQLESYANYAHGTHVAGISSKGVSSAKIMSLKLIATDNNAGGQQIARALSLDKNFLMQILMQVLFQLILNKYGGELNAGLGNVFEYAAKQNALTANCSFGITSNSFEQSLADYFESQNMNKPTQSAIEQLSFNLASGAGERMQQDIANAQNTLFVIAAGNDSSNNDVKPVWPANAKTQNAITVAATYNRSSLAKFSNYGANKVEVAAPGVAIRSLAPGNETVLMSGTSMAAPYVTNVATRIRSINPRLSPAETKRIIMETVDVKSFLQGKVSTSGIVNPARAQAAAELSVNGELGQAIAQARAQVADEPESNSSLSTVFSSTDFVTGFGSLEFN